jgi:ERCC4-type nuclease
VRQASLAELAEVSGISTTLAETIQKHLAPQPPTAATSDQD